MLPTKDFSNDNNGMLSFMYGEEVEAFLKQQAEATERRIGFDYIHKKMLAAYQFVLEANKRLRADAKGRERAPDVQPAACAVTVRSSEEEECEAPGWLPHPDD